MLESIVIGIIQGVAEWLPVSSEGLILLARTHLFHDTAVIGDQIAFALFLHLGTALAAIVYFRRDVLALLRALTRYRAADEGTRRLFGFLLVSTVISGGLGLLLVKGLTQFAEIFSSRAGFLNIVIGTCLLVTGALELRAGHAGRRTDADLTWTDGILLGLAQGFAALPGLSRSGLTVSVLLLRDFEKATALRLSFLMSILIVLAGNVALNAGGIVFSAESLAGLLCSFLFGLGTIHLLLAVARRINFGYLVILFGLLTIISVAV